MSDDYRYAYAFGMVSALLTPAQLVKIEALLPDLDRDRPEVAKILRRAIGKGRDQ